MHQRAATIIGVLGPCLAWAQTTSWTDSTAGQLVRGSLLWVALVGSLAVRHVVRRKVAELRVIRERRAP